MVAELEIGLILLPRKKTVPRLQPMGSGCSKP